MFLVSLTFLRSYTFLVQFVSNVRNLISVLGNIQIQFSFHWWFWFPSIICYKLTWLKMLWLYWLKWSQKLWFLFIHSFIHFLQFITLGLSSPNDGIQPLICVLVLISFNFTSIEMFPNYWLIRISIYHASPLDNCRSAGCSWANLHVISGSCGILRHQYCQS